MWRHLRCACMQARIRALPRSAARLTLSCMSADPLSEACLSELVAPTCSAPQQAVTPMLLWARLCIWVVGAAEWTRVALTFARRRGRRILRFLSSLPQQIQRAARQHAEQVIAQASYHGRADVARLRATAFVHVWFRRFHQLRGLSNFTAVLVGAPLAIVAHAMETDEAASAGRTTDAHAPPMPPSEP